MIDFKSVRREFAVGYKIGKPVSTYFVWVVCGEPAVAVSMYGSAPQPTGIGHFDFVPESLEDVRVVAGTCILIGHWEITSPGVGDLPSYSAGRLHSTTGTPGAPSGQRGQGDTVRHAFGPCHSQYWICAATVLRYGS